MRICTSSTICLLSLFFLTAALWLAGSFLPVALRAAGPSPEPGNAAASFARLPELFDDVERLAGEGAWEEAEEKLVDIHRFFFAIVPAPDNSKVREFYQNFGEAMAGIRARIEARELNGLEQVTIPLQMIFLDVMESYHYPMPPSLIFIEEDLATAAEALERDDFEEVEHEIAEVIAFFPRLRVSLLAKGVTEEDFEGCQQFITKIREAVRVKERAAVEEQLRQFEGKIASFKKLYP